MTRSVKLLIVLCLALLATTTAGCQDDITKNIEFLKSDNDAECAFAAKMLGETGEKKALKPLLKVVRDEEKLICRQEAANAAIEIDPERAAQELFAVVSSSDRDTWGHIMASDALKRIGEKATDMLIEALTTGKAKPRKEAAILLGNIGGVKVVDALSKVVSEKSESEPLRKAALLSLGRIRDKGATEPVIEAMTDSRESLSVRAVAMDSISLIDPIIAEPLIFKLMIDEEENIELRNQAAIWIADMPKKEALRPLVDILESEKDGWDRQIIAIGLKRFLKERARKTQVSTRFIGEEQRINLLQAALINKLGKKRIAKNQDAELEVSFKDDEEGGIVGIKLTHKERGVLMDIQLITVTKPIEVGASTTTKLLADMEANPYFKHLSDIVTIKLAGKQGSLSDKEIFLMLSATGKK